MLSLQSLLKMDTALFLYVLVLGYLSFMELFWWLPCRVGEFEGSSQVRWYGGKALCSGAWGCWELVRQALTALETLNHSGPHPSASGRIWAAGGKEMYLISLTAFCSGSLLSWEMNTREEDG